MAGRKQADDGTPEMTRAGSRPLVLPRKTDPCLCGSGNAFRDCCRDHLPGRTMNEAWREPARKKQWLAVRRALRADITQYTAYHRTNTVPIIRLGVPLKIDILTVDIEALNECIERLAAVYWQLGKLSDFPAVLERLRANIDDPRWQRRITYQQAMTAHLLDDSEGASRELAKLGPITCRETDLELLQLHIDVNGAEIPPAEKLALYQRVLDLAETRQTRIQYSAAKAVELMLAGDDRSAAEVATTALAEARASEEETPFSPTTEHWFSKLLEVAGIAAHDAAHFAEASQRLRTLLADTETWTPSGRGHLYRCLGDVLRLNRQWEDAATAYREAFALEPDPACRIFEASCLLLQQRSEDALALVEAVEFASLEVEEKADYAIVYAAVAIALRDIERLDDAAAKLKAVLPLRQYFALENTRYQLAIERARTSIANGQPVPKSSHLLDWFSSLSRWFLVQPNIAGIGINLNAIADDAIAARRRRPENADKRDRTTSPGAAPRR